MTRRDGTRAARIELDRELLIRAHRGRFPVKLRARFGAGGVAPLAEAAYHAAVLASRPFRLGTRFRTVPDVRLYAGDDLIRSPGDRLPGPEDRSFAQYLARVSAAARAGARTGTGTRTGAAPFQLLVTHPLAIDFALWATVRDLLHRLFMRVGHPVLPVVAELLLGTFTRSPRGLTKRLHHDVLTLVLAGRLRARLWDELWAPSPNELRDLDSPVSAPEPLLMLDARPGDVLYWPADRWHVDEALAPCLALRLWIPASGADTTAVVKQTAAELLAARLGPESGVAVPYLPYPARELHPTATRTAARTRARTRARALPAAAAAAAHPLLHAAHLLDELARGPALSRELAITWAKRVSACGLEPAPPPLPITLAPGDRVRRDPRTPIVRMPHGGESIWAVNGRAFSLRGPGERALQRILASLTRHARAARVDALCGGDEGLHAALEILAELRALEVIPARRSAEVPA